jgi:hypothetical protein
MWWETAYCWTSDYGTKYRGVGMSPDEILLHYPSINLSDIYAALAYYYDHREEIRKQIEDDEFFALAMKKNTVSLVQQKLRSQHER